MILLQAAPESNPMITFVMMGLIFVVFYFFMIRPQQKKQKEQRNFRDSVAKGDRVITSGGIHGKVESVKDTVIIMTTEDGGKLRVEKSAIASEYSPQDIAKVK